MKRLMLVTAIAVLMSGCAEAQFNIDQAGLPPADHKAVVSNYIKSSFFDPYSLRDVAISDPAPGVMFFRSGYLVCFQANGKNRMGGYTGIHRTALLLSGGVVVSYLEGDARCFTPEFAMAPWPEMEGK